MSDAERVERLLRMAFAPVEPPEALSDRLERGLTEMADAAADELAEWELSAMSDPRNWAPPGRGRRGRRHGGRRRWSWCAPASSRRSARSPA